LESTVENKPKSKIVELIAVSVGHFTNDFYMSLIPPILFLFASTLGLSLTQQGTISFAILMSSSVLQPVVGYFADKYAKSWFLIASIVWVAFWMSISGIVGNYYLLLLVLSLGGIASAFYHPLGSTVAVNLSSKTKGTGISVFMTIGGFAATTAPLVAVPLVNTYGLGSLIFLMIPGFIIAFLMYKAKLHKVDFVDASTHKDHVKAKIGKYEVKWISFLATIATIRTFVLRTLITFGIQILILKGTDLGTAAILLSAFMFTESAGTFVGGFLADLIGPKRVFMLSTIVATACAVVLVLSSGIIMYAAFILLGFCYCSTNASNIVLAQDLIPQNKSFATGIMMGLSATIGGFGLLIYSAVADSFGLIFATGCLIIPMVLCVIITTILPNQFDNNRKIEEEYFDNDTPTPAE